MGGQGRPDGCFSKWSVPCFWPSVEPAVVRLPQLVVVLPIPPCAVLFLQHWAARRVYRASNRFAEPFSKRFQCAKYPASGFSMLLLRRVRNSYRHAETIRPKGRNRFRPIHLSMPRRYATSRRGRSVRCSSMRCGCRQYRSCFPPKEKAV